MDTKQKANSTWATLIGINVRWLCQALELLDRLDDGVYKASPAGFAPHCAGGHLRHIVEFYQCFLNGIDSLHIDYDARRRDVTIEKSRAAAAEAVRTIIARLEACAGRGSDAAVRVCMEDAAACELSDSFMTSSLTLRLHGVAMDPAFGMAPSTLRYLAAREAA